MTTGMGVVDELSVADGRLTLRGWAITADQRLPSRLWVRLGGALQAIDDFEKQTRPDVQRHLQLDHALYGYRATIAVPGVERLSQLGPDFAVYGDEPGTPFRIAAPLAGQLAPRAG
jgi:hypothetical protein